MHAKWFSTGFLLLSIYFDMSRAISSPPMELITQPQREFVSSTPHGASVGAIFNSSNNTVYYSSDAWNITTNLTIPPSQAAPSTGIYAIDLSNGQTRLITKRHGTHGPAAGNSVPSSSSPDGRYLLFQSDAPDLVEGDTNGVSDIFVHDNQLGTTRLLSRGDQNALGDGVSVEARFLDGGKKVLFRSWAQNLKPGPNRAFDEYYLLDRDSGKIIWRSWNSFTNIISSSEVDSFTLNNGIQIDSGGKIIVWSACLLPRSDRRQIASRILAYNVETGSSTNLSQDVVPMPELGRDPWNRFFDQPAVSDDLTKVAFRDYEALIFRDLAKGEVRLIATNGVVSAPSFSASGDRILFQQVISNINQAVVWDINTGTSMVASATSDGTRGDSAALMATFMGPDENQVVFLSSSTNLSSNAVSRMDRIHRKNLTTGVVELIGPPNLTSGIESFQVSKDGKWMIFETQSSGIVQEDVNENTDIFLMDLETEAIKLVSRINPMIRSSTPSRSSQRPKGSFSTGGSRVVFTSTANNLVTNDFNKTEDVFVHELSTGESRLVSENATGASGNNRSFSPLLSGDGKTLLYLTLATDLLLETKEAPSNSVFVILERGQERILVNTNYLVDAPRELTEMALSKDGSRLAFEARGGDVGTHLCIFDVITRTMQQMKIPIVPNYSPLALSEDGRWLFVGGAGAMVDLANSNRVAKLRRPQFWGTNGVTLQRNDGSWVLTNLQSRTSHFIAQGSYNISISGNGQLAAFFTSKELHIKNLLNGWEDIAPYTFPDSKKVRRVQFLNSDLIVVHTSEPLLPADTNGCPEFYIYHIPSAFLARLDDSNFPYSRWSNKSLGYNEEKNLLLIGSGDHSLLPSDFNGGTDFFTLSLQRILDSDADGLLDPWEKIYFDNLSQKGPEDFDGDGLSNAREQQLRTDPNDPGSRPRLVSERNPRMTSVRMRVEPPNPQIQYLLERTEALGTKWELLPPAAEQYFIEPTGQNSFFRLRIE